MEVESLVSLDDRVRAENMSDELLLKLPRLYAERKVRSPSLSSLSASPI